VGKVTANKVRKAFETHRNGRGKYFYENGKPCCSWGVALNTVGISSYTELGETVPWNKIFKVKSGNRLNFFTVEDNAMRLNDAGKFKEAQDLIIKALELYCND